MSDEQFLYGEGGAMTARVSRIAGSDASLETLIQRLISVSCVGLPKMYREPERCFAHSRVRASGGGTWLRGTSLRYGGIVLLGVRWVDEEMQRSILAGETAEEFCARLAQHALASSDLGDVAIVTWAAEELGQPSAGALRERMLRLLDGQPVAFSVEVAWVLSALSAAHEGGEVKEAARRVQGRLLGAFSRDAGVFRHRAGSPRPAGIRDHVACFADQVYPIQALARFHKSFGDEASLAAARQCADRICRLQGEQGQWWWHYDTRTGGVVEGYPVYSVHQDAMGPMALFDLDEAGGGDHSGAIRRSLGWMASAHEVGHSLIDDELGLIWRKVARSDPRKLVRGIRALTTRLHPDFRLRALDALFPTSAIDFESRPYHLGWVLHTWLGHL